MLRSGFRDRCPTAHARLSELSEYAYERVLASDDPERRHGAATLAIRGTSGRITAWLI